jgi:uncharacterized membrane protein HdeD (DUF308 family)
MAAVDPKTGLPPDADDGVAAAVAAIGRAWWVALAVGVISVLVGILAVAWPSATVLVVAVLFAVWLIVSGIFQLARSFSHGLSGGNRAMLIISGILSIILGLLALRGAFQAVEILAIFIAIGFLFRGFITLLLGIEGKGQEGRGWNIFFGILAIIGGIIVLEWPGITVVVLAWVTGIWLIVLGIFEIFAGFRLRKAGRAAERSLAS